LGIVDRSFSAPLDYGDFKAKLVGFRVRGTRPPIADALLRLRARNDRSYRKVVENFGSRVRGGDLRPNRTFTPELQLGELQ
jgi:hypothetical protein